MDMFQPPVRGIFRSLWFVLKSHCLKRRIGVEVCSAQTVENKDYLIVRAPLAQRSSLGHCTGRKLGNSWLAAGGEIQPLCSA